MNLLKKITTLVAIAMVLCTSLPAEECDCDCEGPCGYSDCCNAFSISPIMAFGAIAFVTTIAVVVQNSNNDCCKHHNWHS